MDEARRTHVTIVKEDTVLEWMMISGRTLNSILLTFSNGGYDPMEARVSQRTRAVLYRPPDLQSVADASNRCHD
jgi:hypothetical protein